MARTNENHPPTYERVYHSSEFGRAGAGFEAAAHLETLEVVREAADWFNGYLGWLDHEGLPIPEGAEDIYAKLRARTPANT